MNNKQGFWADKGNLISLIFIALMLLLGTLAYPHLPEQIPSHWNMRGEVDGYSGRAFGTYGMPLIILGLLLMFHFLPMIDPRHKNYDQFKKPYQVLKISVLALMTMLYVISMLYALGVPLNISFLVNISIGFLFILIGNYLGKVKHNYFVGVKTPWTLASEDVWKKTHRLAGPLMAIAGALFVLGAFIDHPAFYFIPIGGILLAAFVPMIYSYLLYKKLYPDGQNKL